MKDYCLVTLTTELALLVEQENTRQLAKWGVQEHEAVWWLAFITEEVGELSMAISEWQFRAGIAKNIVDEAIQIATLALKVAEGFKQIDKEEKHDTKSHC